MQIKIMKIYNFNQEVERKHTDCIKYDAMEKFWGIDDAFPMWVAYMDFKTPDFIIETLQNRLKHEILGYSFKTQNYYKSIQKWLKERHNFKVQINELSSSPGVVTGFSMAIQKFTNQGDKIIVQPPRLFSIFQND